MPTPEAKPAGGSRPLGKTGLLVSRIGYGAMELAGAPKARPLDAIGSIGAQSSHTKAFTV